MFDTIPLLSQNIAMDSYEIYRSYEGKFNMQNDFYRVIEDMQ